MSWKKYGPVWIAAGITVGAGLWYERNGSYVQGEDVAACVAAHTERSAYAYAYGTNAVAVASNAVSAYVTMERLKSIAGELRGMMTEAYDPYGAPLYWLDPDEALPANNAQVSNFLEDQTQWHYTNTVNDGVTAVAWYLQPNVGGSPYFLTLDTRYTNSATVKTRPFYGVVGDEFNVPGCEWFGGSADRTLENLYWGGVGNWWTYAGLGTNLYLVRPLEYVGTNSLVAYSPYVRTNTLDSFRTIAHAMRRSVRVFTPDWSGVLTATASLYTSGSYTINTSSIPAATAAAIATQKAVDGATSTTNVEFTGWSGGSVIDTIGVLAYMRLYTQRQVITTGGIQTGGGTEARATFEKVTHLGLRCSWPCAEAYASGLVSRVRIYLVCEGLMGRQMELTNPTNSGWSVSAYSSDNVHTYSYDDKNLGTGLKLGDHPNNNNYFSNATRYNQFRTVADDYCVRHYWTQLCDVSNPTAAPYFDCGSSFDPTAISTYQAASMTLTSGATTDALTLGLYEQAVRPRWLFVVVDWSWRYL